VERDDVRVSGSPGGVHGERSHEGVVRLDVNDIPFSATDLGADSGSEVIVAVRRVGAHTPDLNVLDTLLRG
jgi:hypothetical protein